MTQKSIEGEGEGEFDPGPEVPDDDWESGFHDRVTETGLAQLQDILDAVKAKRIRPIRGMKLVMDFSNLQRHFLSELGASAEDGEGFEDAQQGGFIQMAPGHNRRRRLHGNIGAHDGHRGPPAEEARAVVQQAAEGARLQALTHALNGAIQLDDQPLIARLRAELYASLTPDLIPGGLGLPTPANDDIPLAPRPPA